MNRIDKYIIKKFLGTFFYSLVLLLLLVIVIDMSEKIDDFIENNLSFYTIISQYYIHFIPYFANLFSPLFVFISVIFFTSKLASNFEIIAIFNSGMSFKRLLRPFMISSVFLALLSFFLGNFIIPFSNKYRLDFENKYLNKNEKILKKDIHIKTDNNQFIYLQSYNNKSNIGSKFSLENFDNGQLISKLRADHIQWNRENNKWTLNKYEVRRFYKERESFKQGNKKDTNINLSPEDFIIQPNLAQRMTLFELNKSIIQEEETASGRAKFYKIEKHKRIAFPFASIILTFIAVALSVRKIKSGIGYNLGIGLLISFSYILFFQFSSTLSINGNLEAWIAVWIPNIVFIILGLFLLRKANNN